MITRFRIVEGSLNIDNDICGQAVSNVSTGGLALKIEVAGEVVIDTDDLSVFDLVSNPVNITLTNGIVVGLTLEDVYYYTLNVAYPMPLNPRVFDSTTLRIITGLGTDFSTYDQIFEIYDYDLGNNPNINNIDGNPIDYNPNMDIVLNANALTIDKVYSSFTAYRKPFSDLIQIYNLFSSPHACAYYDVEDSHLLFIGTLGYICHAAEITIKQVLTNGIEDCDSTVEVPAKQWIPDWSVAVSCSNCGDNCVNTISDNTAITTIDYSTLSKVFRNDEEIYPYQDQQIVYNLYNYAGDLIDSYAYSFKLGAPDTSFVPGDGAWSGFKTPSIGDYVLRTSLIITGIDTGNEIDSTGELLENRWYRITDPASGDFTDAGASDNNLGTDFAYNGGAIVWDTATVNLLSNLVECFKNTILSSCSWFDVKKTACSDYTVYNRSFNGIYVKVSAMNSDGTFTAITGYSSYLLTGLSSFSISLTTDNIYKIEQIPDPIANVDVVLPIILVYAYCNIQTCGLEFINKILCNKETDHCKDYFKDVYDYVAFMTTLFTYFNILNAEYSFNYIYDGLSPNKIIELQSAKEVLDRLTGYCVSSSNCTTCGSTQSCNCHNH